MQAKTLGTWASFFTSVGAGALTQTPDYQWLALPVAIMSGALFFILIGMYLFSNRREIFRLAKLIEPFHITVLGLVLAAGGVAWQAYREPPAKAPVAAPPQHSSLPPTKITTPVSLNEEGRRFREQLRRFVLSDIGALVEAWGYLAASTPAEEKSRIQNTTTASAADREKIESLSLMYDSTRPAYEKTVAPLLDAANKPADQLNLDEVAEELKIFSKSYRDDCTSFVRFVFLSGVRINQDALERWKVADENAAKAFRDLKTYPDTASLVNSWQSNGVFNPMYDWFRQRMRTLEATANAK